MEWYEQEVRHLERRNRQGRYPSSPAAFFGSSSIRLWDTLDTDFPGAGIVNLGFGGSTLEACAHFFSRIVSPCHPRSLLLYAGDNDLGDGRSPEDVLASFVKILKQVDDLPSSIPLAFLSIKPSPARWHLDHAIRRANALVLNELAARDDRRFIDIYPKMLNPHGEPRWELYQDDGLHLSRLGYELWASAVREHVSFLF